MPGSATSGRIALSVLCVGLFLSVGVPVGWNLTRVPVDAGSLPARADPAGHRAALISRRAPQAPAETGSAVQSAWFPANIGVQSARLRDAETMEETINAPVEVSIAALGIRARVKPVGIVLPQETMEIPREVRTVGWYRFGPSPGKPGSAILVGHVDSRTQGRGAFFGLAHLRIGASISVENEDGTKLAFKVVARRSYPKERLPRQIFDRTGPPMLTLVTCGGPFDEGTRRYDDNIVIFAVGS